MNCLNRRLVDLLKTSSYDLELVNLFLRAKGLIDNSEVAHFWGTNRTNRKGKEKKKKEKEKREMYKRGNDWGAQTPAKIHAWEICVVFLFTLSLSSSSINDTKQIQIKIQIQIHPYSKNFTISKISEAWVILLPSEASDLKGNGYFLKIWACGLELDIAE